MRSRIYSFLSSPLGKRSAVLLVCSLLAASILWNCLAATLSQKQPESPLGPAELDTRSEYSRIKVRKQGNVRSLCFIRDNGVEVLESQMDLGTPHRLMVPYTRTMFAGYLFQPVQRKVLMVGLGAGSMIQFLKHHAPDVRIDAVEIDPTVVAVADRYFGTRSGGNVQIMTADGFDYLGKTTETYDAIYMDAFLKPSAQTDVTGIPLNMKTVEFYKAVQGKLTPGGVVVFNVNEHENLPQDIATIAAAFPQAYVFLVPDKGNQIVVGSTVPQRATAKDLRAVGHRMDQRIRTNFTFESLVDHMLP